MASIAIVSRPTTFVTVRMLLTVVISLVVVVVRMTALGHGDCLSLEKCKEGLTECSDIPTLFSCTADEAAC